ncbi:MAG TPA: alginate export family protein [Bryobacteraceae bacterium]|nr:alginate export family protein [Bryobacteraceae bacterium]
MTIRVMGLAALGFCVAGAALRTAAGQTYKPGEPGGSQAATTLVVPGANPYGWAFPITQLDERLPAWIRFGGQFRDRMEASDHISYGTFQDGYDLTQMRFGLYLQPSKWFGVVAVTQDSRIFFNQHVAPKPPYQNTWDFREAYARIGSATAGIADVVVGRQMLSFGDERVIGPSDWSNMGRTFDVVRLDLHPKNITASILAASVINAIDGHIDHHIEGNNLYGIYSSFRKVIPKAVLEPYVLWRVAPGNIALAETAGHGAMSEWTVGAHAAGATTGSFDYDVEMNKQTGSLGHYDIDAWAGHWNVGRTFAGVAAAPRTFVEYNYATGNRNPASNTWSTHDQLYASAHDKMEFADQFGWRNIQDLRAGVQEKLAKRWQLTEMVNNLWLATRNDAVYASSGAAAIAAHPNATSSHLGTELDLIAVFRQNPHMTYGAGYCKLVTGEYLKETTPGKDYLYPFAYATYVF